MTIRKRDRLVAVDPVTVAGLILPPEEMPQNNEEYRDYYGWLTDRVEDLTGSYDPGLIMAVAQIHGTCPAGWFQFWLARSGD